jgi:preprotein translocase subunit SecA
MAGRGTDIKLSPEVVECGGLHVVATQRHQSQRIDRQLIGRSARQGDPGSAQFFVSAEDALLERYGPWLARGMKRAAQREGELNIDVDAHVRKIQQRAEQIGYTRRRQLFRYDNYRDGVMSKLAGREDCWG